MIGNANYRWHAVQVLEELEPFVTLRAGSMSNGEQIALVYQMRALVRQLQLLTDEARTETGGAAVEAKLERSIKAILSANPVV